LPQSADPAVSATAGSDNVPDAKDYAEADLILWKGFCHVHTDFTVEHVAGIRREYPDAFVIVHPECTEEVVAMADATGSTEGIVRRVMQAKAGETICIGTEINLVARLADRRPDLTVVPLAISVCPNMSKITLGHLLWTLENPGEVNVVEVDREIARDAELALRRMLELG
jgi:quinolinate synthase